jgi:hypothetical protein
MGHLAKARKIRRSEISGKHERGRPRRKCRDDVKVYLREISSEVERWLVLPGVQSAG